MINMQNSNIASFDSKGRLLIPSHVRKALRAEEGTEIVLVPDDKKGYLKIIPLVKGKTAEIRFLLQDVPGSLARVAELLSRCNLDIIVSESRTLAKGKLAEWDVMVDTSECNDLEGLRKKSLELENVKKMEMLKNK